MDDVYRINAAKTDFREAYRTGDVELLLSVFHPAGFADMSDGRPSKYGEAARIALRERAAALFCEYHVKLDVIIIDVVVLGDTAYDFGWHEYTFSPKAAGEMVRKRERYFELWKRDPAGSWKIVFFVNNADVPEHLGGFVSHWFKSQDGALKEA
jgi:ketosteroid isomerase-like protein